MLSTKWLNQANDDLLQVFAIIINILQIVDMSEPFY